MIMCQQDLTSIHSLSAELQVPSKTIERVALDLSIAPALRLNMLVYFDREQADAIANHLQDRGKSRMVATSTAERLVVNANVDTLASG